MITDSTLFYNDPLYKAPICKILKYFLNLSNVSYSKQSRARRPVPCIACVNCFIDFLCAFALNSLSKLTVIFRIRLQDYVTLICESKVIGRSHIQNWNEQF